MKIYVTSVVVDDQDKAEKFYVDVLGFKVRNDIPLGEDRWLTVVSSKQPDGPELLLDPVPTQQYRLIRTLSLLTGFLPTHSKSTISMRSAKGFATLTSNLHRNQWMPDQFAWPYSMIPAEI
jgi:catechol 2,3-dioxygenase-like lactoylglutathione lyase family enzyme